MWSVELKDLGWVVRLWFLISLPLWPLGRAWLPWSSQAHIVQGWPPRCCPLLSIPSPDYQDRGIWWLCLDQHLPCSGHLWLGQGQGWKRAQTIQNSNRWVISERRGRGGPSWKMRESLCAGHTTGPCPAALLVLAPPWHTLPHSGPACGSPSREGSLGFSCSCQSR